MKILLDILVLAAWAVTGAIVLTSQKVAKAQYGLIWAVLILHLIIKLLLDWSGR